MKTKTDPKTHPSYVVAKVICACGNVFETRSTKSVIKLEICSACHPFYTGKQKLLDTAGRVERFKKRFAQTGGKMVMRKPKKTAVRTAAAKPKTLSTAPKARDSDKQKPKKKAKAKASK